ncbi:MAG TPA: M48 family metallopeptidase [Bacillota bacterium]|nr:M48 family metallopeptidase [Bacillota bacterium]
MRRFYLFFILILVVYIAVVSYYLLHASSSLPKDLIGGAADPTTFMSKEQIQNSLAFSRINDVFYFTSGPIEWAIYLLILGLGLSSRFRKFAETAIRGSFLRLLVFIFLLSITTTIIEFPMDYYLFQLRHEYGISNEPFTSWMKDNVKGFWISLVMTAPVAWLFFFFLRKSPKRWWLWSWLLSIPIFLFFMFIQPVVLDPIFHQFTPLHDQQLKREILDLAAKANIPTNQVYEVDMSKKTNALNAYVNGIGSNTRIVLWDTTLNKLKKDEILFIMAHEMGHYALRHMQWLFIGSVFMILAALLALYYTQRWVIERFGEYWGIKGLNDMASLPIILLFLSVLSFVSMPIQNAVSRQYEHAADVYAMNMMHDKDAAVRTFQRLAVESLSEVNPPALVKYFLYGHPTLHERILFVENYK